MLLNLQGCGPTRNDGPRGGFGVSKESRWLRSTAGPRRYLIANWRRLRYAIRKFLNLSWSIRSKGMGHIYNNSIERRTPMPRATKPMSKRGPRAKAWDKVWRFLKPRLDLAGRTRCEFGFIAHDCGGILTPAHSKKRGKIKGAELFHVALCCLNFHRVLDEQMTHEEMESTVMRAVEEAGGLILPERY